MYTLNAVDLKTGLFLSRDEVILVVKCLCDNSEKKKV